MKKKQRIIFLLLALSIYQCKTVLPRGFEGKNDDSFLHYYSNTFFPNRIGGFAVVSVNAYDNAGYNVSVGYNANNLTVTHYIYPAIQNGRPIALSDHWVDYSNVMKKNNKDLVVLFENSGSLEKAQAKCSKVAYQTNFGGQDLEVASFLYILLYKGWFLKIRSTTPMLNYAAGTNSLREYFKNFPTPDNQITSAGDILKSNFNADISRLLLQIDCGK